MLDSRQTVNHAFFSVSGLPLFDGMWCNIFRCLVELQTSVGILSLSLLHPGTLHRADIFEVDPDSGTVKVRNSALLDREKQAVFYLTLQATDGGGLSSSTTLRVELLDINDNEPVVIGSYNIFVQEESGNVSVTIQVHACLGLVGRTGDWSQAWLCSHVGPGPASRLCCVALRKLLSLSGPPFPLGKMKVIILLIPKVTRE